MLIAKGEQLFECFFFWFDSYYVKVYLLLFLMWQLASIHRHLDEMDRKLNAMQLEMEDALVMSEYDVLVGSLNKTSGSDNAVRNDANFHGYHLYEHWQALWLLCFMLLTNVMMKCFSWKCLVLDISYSLMLRISYFPFCIS